MIHCRICQREVDQPPRGRKREYHPECKAVALALEGLAANLHRVEFATGEAGEQAALLTRRALFGHANSLPVTYHNERDDKGRFRR
jgi:hypothetical protein